VNNLAAVIRRRPRSVIGDDENMALESFLLHFRNLRAFLCPSLQPIKPDDILASDLLNETNACDHGDAKALGRGQKRIDQMLAHLSYNREKFIEAMDYEWKVAEMRELILGQLEAFFKLLSPAERSWFPDAQFITKSKAYAAALAQASLGTQP
jgi:hypothetical protein